MLTNEYQRFAHPDERERLGREIDETADVLILGRRAGVPYGDDMDPKWDGYGSHKTWYAVTPDGIAVCFGDIPDETCKALEEKVGRRHLSREEAADLPY